LRQKIFGAVGAIVWCVFGLTMWSNVFLDFEQYGPVPFSKYLLSISPGAAAFYCCPVIGMGISLAAFWLLRDGKVWAGIASAVFSLLFASVLVALSFWGAAELGQG
jgi:hypothetical protein